ncbi:MAG: hypothetical protein ACJAT1_000006 [Marivirga sp.]|jgi:hypothetical protein
MRPFKYLLIIIVFTACRQESLIPEEQSVITNNYFLVEDEVGGEEIVVVANASFNFISAYGKIRSDGEQVELSASDRELPALLKDLEGNYYDIFGTIISGPDKGLKLLPLISYKAYWFSVSSFFPGIDLYNAESIEVGDLGLTYREDWLIPTANLYVGSSKDGIPAIDNPVYKESGIASEFASQEPTNEQLIVGVILNGIPKAIPYNIMNWHEIVNNVSDSIRIGVSHCPLTGSSLAFKIKEGQSTFGVSGLLYNSNLIMYDRGTDANLWQQMTLVCVNGPQIGERLVVFPSVEMSYLDWKNIYPETEFLTETTGQVRDYSLNPYPAYDTNDDLIYYPVDFKDDRIPGKEKVLCVIVGDSQKAYSLPLTIK